VDTFNISAEATDRGVHVIPVAGYVDFDAAPQLKRRIVQRIDEGGRLLVIDLSEAGFIDSTGIHDVDGSLAVVCPDAAMRNIFEIVGLEDVIPLHTSREDAVSAIAVAA
jgi:anti-sigma B factor antagonist